MLPRLYPGLLYRYRRHFHFSLLQQFPLKRHPSHRIHSLPWLPWVRQIFPKSFHPPVVAESHPRLRNPIRFSSAEAESRSCSDNSNHRPPRSDSNPAHKAATAPFRPRPERRSGENHSKNTATTNGASRGRRMHRAMRHTSTPASPPCLFPCLPRSRSTIPSHPVPVWIAWFQTSATTGACSRAHRSCDLLDNCGSPSQKSSATESRRDAPL